MVDDNMDIRRLNAEVLTEAGYKVDAAVDGAVAWTALQLFDYALLITDNEMPAVSGVELIMRLRVENMKLPVVLMSGTIPTEVLNQHPWLQIQATLVKPYSVPELLTTVKNVLRPSRHTQALSGPPQNWQRLPTATHPQVSRRAT